jgi:hypothetical protein
VWDVGPVYSTQIGAFASLASAKNRAERGFVVALWRKF